MSQTQSSPKLHVRRVLTTLVALGVVLAPLAFATDQSMTGTVATVNTFSITEGGTVALAPTIATPAVDTSTILAFNTNDGLTYTITVIAASTGWTLSGQAATAEAGTYPVLRFVSATAGAATVSGATTELIGTNNAVTAANVLTGIKNVDETTTVTLDASITQTVVAGSYGTTLTYAITTTP